MNDPMNTPGIPGPARPSGISGWFSIWKTAVISRSEQTYARLAEHPEAATPNRALLWVFLAGTASAVISGILQSILAAAGFTSQMAALTGLFGSQGSGIAFYLGISICLSPVAGALAALFFAIVVAIMQWVAKMFGGVGTFSRLAYPLAAISVPFSLLSAVLTPFNSIPYVVVCTGLISLALGIYAIVLQITAVKGVNHFGWGQAIGSYFLPSCPVMLCSDADRRHRDDEIAWASNWKYVQHDQQLASIAEGVSNAFDDNHF